MTSLRDARVLSAVQALGAPTTIDVAEKCGLTSREARESLHRLSASCEIRPEGSRRWTVPSRALPRDPDPAHEAGWEVDVDPPGKGCGCAIASFLIVFAIGLLSIIRLVYGAL